MAGNVALRRLRIASGSGGALSGALDRRLNLVRWYAAPTKKKASPPPEKRAATPNAAKASRDKKAAKGDGAKEVKKDSRHRFDDLLDACLNAPSPVRALKEKDRTRLQKLEALGILTKDSASGAEEKSPKRKVAKGAKGPSAAKVIEDVQSGDGDVVVGEAGGETSAELTQEEGMRLAKEYSRVMLREARERAKGEAVRLQLKKEALAALPQHLREAALVPDLTPFPKNRIPASLTPPIQGYVEDRAKQSAQFQTVKKTR